MFYSKLVCKACNIMYEAHKNDMDKGNYPYVFHPFFLATQMSDEDTTCVALLHDVIEDHGDKYNFELLEKEGFSANIMNALKLLTHEKDIPYMEYVIEIAKNPIARAVKIEDLKHNLDLNRNGGIKPKKYEVYLKALKYLKSID